MWKQASPKQSVAEARTPASPNPAREPKKIAGLGKSIVIKGDITGSEDMTIDGHVEGRVDLKGHALLIGPNAVIHANVAARVITIMGAVIGNVTADKVDLRSSGSVDGDIISARVAMADGALFRGSIDTLTSAREQEEPFAIAV